MAARSEQFWGKVEWQNEALRLREELEAVKSDHLHTSERLRVRATEVERLTERTERLERGLLTLTAWLTQVPGCLGQHEYERLRKIVQGDEESRENPE
jgi:hypothetical protein